MTSPAGVRPNPSHNRRHLERVATGDLHVEIDRSYPHSDAAVAHARREPEGFRPGDPHTLTVIRRQEVVCAARSLITSKVAARKGEPAAPTDDLVNRTYRNIRCTSAPHRPDLNSAAGRSIKSQLLYQLSYAGRLPSIARVLTAPDPLPGGDATRSPRPPPAPPRPVRPRAPSCLPGRGVCS
jgi:hypothetical protein